VVDEIFDELTRGLLRDPEVLGHVGGCGVAFTDPRKRETMCGANVIEATVSKTILNPIHKLTGQTQYSHGHLPVVARHDDHLDIF
jgi:hypothetical protein